MYIREIALDILFPACCPVCGDAIPLENRMKMVPYGAHSAAGGRDAAGKCIVGAEHSTVGRHVTSEGEIAAKGYWAARECGAGGEKQKSGVRSTAKGYGAAVGHSAGSGHGEGGRRYRRHMDAYICPECVEEFDYIREPYCKKCGKQLMISGGSVDVAGADMGGMDGCGTGNGSMYAGRHGGFCADCAARERDYIQCRCLMTYDTLAREVLIGLKYHGRKDSAYLLGGLAAARLAPWIRAAAPDMIVPVPVHPDRLKKRGYNQAELIAREIGEELGIPVVSDLLKRRKKTRALKELSRDDRLMMIHDAFAAEPGGSAELKDIIRKRCRAVSGHALMRTDGQSALCRAGRSSGSAVMYRPVRAAEPSAVRKKADAVLQSGGRSHTHEKNAAEPVALTALLVDDIYTTGATMETCTRILKDAGIARVYGLCIAAGRDDGR